MDDVEGMIKNAVNKVNLVKGQLQVNTVTVGDKIVSDQMGKLAYAFRGINLAITGSDINSIGVQLASFYKKVTKKTNI